MLPIAYTSLLKAQVQMYWSLRMLEPDFTKILSGREVGHKIAPQVEEETVKLLSFDFKSGTALLKDGSEAARSMGDTWLSHNFLWHPINVKTGVAGKTGRPNLVSLRRLITALANGEIDSYWLVFVHFGEDADVQVVDLLDHLDLVGFDAGTGQLMLKGAEFLEHVEDCHHTPASIEQKLETLWSIYEEGVARLIKNRTNTLSQLRETVKNAAGGMNQAGLKF